MKIHYLQHVPFEGIGSIATWAEKNQHQVTKTALFENSRLPEDLDFDLLLVMGGPMGVYDTDKYPWLEQEKVFVKKAIEANKKVLGICLGAQLIAEALGARVFKNEHVEIGWHQVHGCTDFFPDSFEAFHWHGDTFELPQGAIHLAENEACKNQAFIWNDDVLALQFHLETTYDSAKLLVDNLSEELIDAPYIQSAETMLSADDKFHKINLVMNETLVKLGC